MIAPENTVSAVSQGCDWIAVHERIPESSIQQVLREALICVWQRATTFGNDRDSLTILLGTTPCTKL